VECGEGSGGLEKGPNLPIVIFIIIIIIIIIVDKRRRRRDV
jgi:hypothetical protein